MADRGSVTRTGRESAAMADRESAAKAFGSDGGSGSSGRGTVAESGGSRTVRHAVIAMVLIGLGAFTVVGAATVFAAESIAKRTALAEAARSAQLMGNVIFKPVMPRLIRGDRTAWARLDEAVQARESEAGVVRVKVWNRQGVVLYSNEHHAIGMSFPLNDDVRKTIDQHASWADLSDLSDEENITEPHGDSRLVEVYVPLDLPSGERLALEVYSTDERVATARKELMGTLVPFSILALLLLLLAQLPVSVQLLRRVSQADAERSRLLSKALTASERERRAIARDLHDGVVQDLAGAGYALAAVRADLPPGTTAAGGMLDRISEVLRGAVGSLRTLMVDIYPPDLTEDGLPQAVELLAERLRREGLTVTTTVDVRAALGPDLAAAAYRCARECVTNILKHAEAGRAWIDLTGDQDRLLVVVTDDGKGPGTALGTTGHLGLQLIGDTASELGGEVTVAERAGGGTEVRTTLPVRS
ncbi:sensor histidine kinase [Streptomyces sp. NPDC127066]|uniref:sensor histidine kinase n=1 Tax=Streptomyces sp. NPDC127066 TaxID=3347125 RepID=UPI003668CE70